MVLPSAGAAAAATCVRGCAGADSIAVVSQRAPSLPPSPVSPCPARAAQEIAAAAVCAQLPSECVVEQALESGCSRRSLVSIVVRSPPSPFVVIFPPAPTTR